MARLVKYASYGEAQVFDKLNGQWQGFAYSTANYRSDPADGIDIIGISPAITIGNFTINAIVAILPTGLNQKPKKYFTDATLDSLTTAGA